MTTTQTATTPAKSSQKSPRSSSIIHKLANPFASKQHPQIIHEIELEEPFRHFAPGDSVQGAVHLNVAKPLRATHLVVRLHGFVKVTSHSRLPGEPIPYDEHLLNSTKGGRGEEYFGNGFARLFEDETVLCGDGRLLGQYVFRFELDLPRTGMPSSIDFENGTITYLITSTLTRPATISPTSIKHFKLKVKENIDIARIPIPRPQSVSLEAITRRRPVIHMKRRFSAQQGEKGIAKTSQDESRDASSSSPPSTGDTPGSPVPSELSSVSVTSSSTSNVHTAAGKLSTTDAKSITGATTPLSPSDKTVTAQTEVLQGGCLPGDIVPIKVSIDHTRPIKSMQGVIVTLYRSARVDTNPALLLGPSSSQGHAKYEDYYPKSRTGLGGLSFSAAGSSRTFRQDLAQTITPLIVDPQSLIAIIKTSIQIPEHIFPTINGVPGSMIIFKYFVEVVIDLRGKLGQGLLPKLSMTDTPQHAYEDPRINMEHSQNGTNLSATPGFNYLITDQIRRQKGVVYTKSEVIIGTRDTARWRGRQRYDSGAAGTTWRSAHLSPSEGDQPIQTISCDHAPEYSHYEHLPGPAQSHASHPSFIPPPPATEEPLDEKARIRRAEQTLLPSEPPHDEETPFVAAPTPSAPLAYDEEDFVHRYTFRTPAPAYDAASTSPASPTIQAGNAAQSLPILGTNENEHGVGVYAMAGSLIRTGDDKQELERQRLQMLTSSPSSPSDATIPGGPATQQASFVTPSAPILFEDDVRNGAVEQAAVSNLSALDYCADPTSPTSNPSIVPLPGKQEMERLRLQQLGSSPDDDTGDDDGAPPDLGPQALIPSGPVLDRHDARCIQNDDANETNNENLAAYKR
ncbi:MAG: hypothetical protein Q9164_003296 [Protoblastenia rupestris]